MWRFSVLRFVCFLNRVMLWIIVAGRKSLSLQLNGRFPGGPRLAGTRMSPFWILLELRMAEVVVTAGAIKHAKLQSKRHRQQTNTQLFTTGCPSCCRTNSVKALKGKMMEMIRGNGNNTNCDTDAVR